ncbi:hypothetical protein [Flindersiella endophytica]
MSNAAGTTRRNRTLIAIVIAVVVLAIPPTVMLLVHRPESQLKLAADLAPAVRAEHERTVAAHVTKEQRKAWGTNSGDQLNCAVQELGEEPVLDAPGRTRVYVWVLCRSNDQGKSAISQPMSVDIGTQAAPVTSYTPDIGDATEIRTHFPELLHEAAIDRKGVDLGRLNRQLN